MSGWLYQTPQNWDSYLPREEDYDSAEEYIAALLAGSQDTSAPANGGWVNSRAEREPGFQQNVRTDRDVAVGRFDNYVDPNNSFNKGMGGATLRLDSSIANNPDAARLAYGAYDEFGNPLLDPAVLAMIEDRLGIGPYEGPVDPNLPNAPGGAPYMPHLMDPSQDTGDRGDKPPMNFDRTGGPPANVVNPYLPPGLEPNVDNPNRELPSFGGGPLVADEPAGFIGPGNDPFAPAGPNVTYGQSPLPQAATFTIDPTGRYPDFLFQGKGSQPRPALRLGGY